MRPLRFASRRITQLHQGAAASVATSASYWPQPPAFFAGGRPFWAQFPTLKWYSMVVLDGHSGLNQGQPTHPDRANLQLLPPTGATGLEPATSDVTGRRSNQLSYAPGEREVWQASWLSAA